MPTYLENEAQIVRPEEAWQSTIGELELSIGRASYVTWLKSARLVSYEDGQFVVGVQNGYVKEWMESRMVPQLKKNLGERLGRIAEVSVVLVSNSGLPAYASITNVAPRAEPATRVIYEPERNPTQSTGNSVSPNSTVLADGLVARYTFETFVVGSGNRMAHAAASAVAESPADRYNPLFLYGGSGLGKTHLLHAIGHAARLRGMRAWYVTSETFTNELISSIRSQATDAFRNRYRYVDMLLMDDVQFIAGKESTQEEFFHTFNALHSANKQIVVTSDRSPKSMITLEDRLRSRFEWGLMADIAPPDYETRVAILQQKAAAACQTVPIPPEVIEFIAKQVQSNVRELEGALTRLVATAELGERMISVQLARDTLADLMGKRANLTPSQVIETVAKFYNISVPEIVSAGRNKELVQPRQVAMYLIRQETDASLPEIGGLLGGRDHTTVMHGVERVKERLESEDQLRRTVMSLREQLYLNVAA